MIETKEFMDNLSQWSDICLSDERIDLELYEKYDVKRGLRDKNGNGVVAGLTKVSKIEANKVVDGVKVPKMSSRDLSFRDAYHGNIAEYLRAVTPEEYERFIGEQSVDFDQILKENKDVLKRLKQVDDEQ